MKKTKNLRTALIDGTLILALAFGITSCGNNAKTEDTEAVADEQNEAKFDDNKTENDADFLVNAAEINLTEIELGTLATTNSQVAEVKELGKMMVDEHTKALNDLKAMAEKKMMTIPTELTADGKDEYKKLSEKTGKDFDKKYCDMMVSGHKNAINKFERASEKSQDGDIKAWATSMLPALRTHLDHSMTCQKMVDGKKDY